MPEEQAADLLMRCAHCQTLLFKVVGPNVVLLARHHGKWHESVIPVADLLYAQSANDSQPDLYQQLRSQR